jgi:hypothetical protein
MDRFSLVGADRNDDSHRISGPAFDTWTVNLMSLKWSQHGLDDRENRVRFPTGAEDFLFTKSSKLVPGASQSLPNGSFSSAKMKEAWHLPVTLESLPFLPHSSLSLHVTVHNSASHQLIL